MDSNLTRDCKHEVALTCNFAVYRRQSRSTADIAPNLTKLNFEPKRISWFHLPLEADVIQTGEERDLAFVLVQSEHRHCPDLGQRFDNQYAGHYGIVWEMSLKKWIAHRHIFDPDSALASFEFLDTVYKQKRIAVRDNLHDLDGVKGCR
jgi:hypothetical protein